MTTPTDFSYEEGMADAEIVEATLNEVVSQLTLGEDLSEGDAEVHGKHRKLFVLLEAKDFNSLFFRLCASRYKQLSIQQEGPGRMY